MRKLRYRIYQFLDMTYFASERGRCKELAQGYALPGGFQRIYHYHIRKTGGTSLNQSFFASLGADPAKTFTAIAKKFNKRLILGDKVVVRDNRYLFNQGNYFYGFSHNPMHALNLPPKTFTVTILRDPFKRVLSHYKMLLQIRELEKKPRFFLKHEAAWLGSGLSGYRENISKEHLLRQVYMFSKNFDVQEAHDNIRGCNFYFFTDNYVEGLKRLQDVLNIKLTVLHRRSTQDIQVEIPDKAREKAMEMLEPEYRLLAMLK